MAPDLGSLQMIYVFLGIAILSLIIILFILISLVRKKSASKTSRRKGSTESAGTALVRKLTSLQVPLTTELKMSILEADTDVLAEVIINQYKYPRSIRAEIFTIVEDSDAVPKFIQNLQHVNYRVRARAAEVIGILESPEAIQPLLLAMQDRNEEVRMEVASALSKLKGKQAVEPLVAALREPNKYVPARVAEVLINLADLAVPLLIEEIHKPDTDKQTRSFICEILGEIKDKRAVQPLITLMDDRYPEVRAKAAEALGIMACEEAVDALACSLDDSVWTVRVQAAKALGNLNNPEAIPFLTQALEDHQWGVRVSAAEALAKIGGQGLEILRRIAQSKEHPVAERAIALLKGR